MSHTVAGGKKQVTLQTELVQTPSAKTGAVWRGSAGPRMLELGADSPIPSCTAPGTASVKSLRRDPPRMPRFASPPPPGAGTARDGCFRAAWWETHRGEALWGENRVFRHIRETQRSPAGGPRVTPSTKARWARRTRQEQGARMGMANEPSERSPGTSICPTTYLATRAGKISGTMKVDGPSSVSQSHRHVHKQLHETLQGP